MNNSTCLLPFELEWENVCCTAQYLSCIVTYYIIEKKPEMIALLKVVCYLMDILWNRKKNGHLIHCQWHSFRQN